MDHELGIFVLVKRLKERKITVKMMERVGE